MIMSRRAQNLLNTTLIFNRDLQEENLFKGTSSSCTADRTTSYIERDKTRGVSTINSAAIRGWNALFLLSMWKNNPNKQMLPEFPYWTQRYQQDGCLVTVKYNKTRISLMVLRLHQPVKLLTATWVVFSDSVHPRVQVDVALMRIG